MTDIKAIIDVHNQKPETVESLRQQKMYDDECIERLRTHGYQLELKLAEANNQVNQLNNMMRDKGFGQGEIDTMGWYEQQLADAEALRVCADHDANELAKQLAETQEELRVCQQEAIGYREQLAEQKRLTELVYRAADPLKKQLAECQARENAGISAISFRDKEIASNQCEKRYMELLQSVTNGIALQPPPPIFIKLDDPTKLDIMKRQWQREALLDAKHVAENMMALGYKIEAIVGDISNMAKELE